jgi:hypothetical protein
MEVFINMELENLPIFSQQRILNSIYKTFRDNEYFPNDRFIKKSQDILERIYNIIINPKKLLNIIVKNKHKILWDNMFENISETINTL